MPNNQNKDKKMKNPKQGAAIMYPTIFNAQRQVAPTFNQQPSHLLPTPPSGIFPIMLPSWPIANPNCNTQVSNNAQYSNQKICLFCQKMPRFSCYRCGAYYCSHECQTNDWNKHRYTCFAMPCLVPIKATVRTVPPISPLPKNRSMVLLTGFRRPNLCYVRSLQPEEDEKYKKAAVAIRKYAASADLMTELPMPNTYAFAFHKKSYQRAQILSVNNSNSIRILFIDVGIVKAVQLTELRKMCENAVKILQHAVAIKLKDVDNYLASDEIDNFLNQFSENKFVLEYNEEDEDKEFVLKQLNCRQTLNETIIAFASKKKHIDVYKDYMDKQLDVACSSKHSLTANLIKPPFQFLQFNKSDRDFVVTVLNDSSVEEGIFSCINRDNLKYLDQIASYFKGYIDTHTAYEPQRDEYCLANINKSWCRVKILNIDEHIYTVMNIDNNTEKDIKSYQIRRYPKDFTVPCTTVLCKLDGLQAVTGNKSIATFMKERFSRNSIHNISRVKKIEDGVTYVHMEDIIDELILYFRHKIN